MNDVFRAPQGTDQATQLTRAVQHHVLLFREKSLELILTEGYRAGPATTWRDDGRLR
jgi:hypothetical protein